MNEGLTLSHGGRDIRLKWHSLRRAADDAPFARANLAAGLALGASVEVDIQQLADGHFVCLHDDRLDSETNGHGAVADADAAAVRRLHVRNGDGSPPMLLEDLVAAIAQGPKPTMPGLFVQLDLKDAAARLTDDAVAAFARLIQPAAAAFILSALDWPAVKRLGGGVEHLALGYDPLDLARDWTFDGRDSFLRFRDAVLETAPEAKGIYLYKEIVEAALRHDTNVVAAFHERGVWVDCWTIDAGAPDDDDYLKAAVAAGVDQITTNTPRALAEALPA